MESHELPADRLLELIFAKLSLVYGRDFIGRWEGLDIGEVKADWRRELDAVLQHPQAVKYALQNLPPDRPPNVLQFRALCYGRPEPMFVALPRPTPSEADRQRVREMLGAVRRKITGEPA